VEGVYFFERARKQKEGGRIVKERIQISHSSQGLSRSRRNNSWKHH